MKLNKLKIIDNKQRQALFENEIKSLLNDASSLDILEAGCGRRWPLKLDGIAHSITGIDADEEALTIRKDKVKDLDKVILGDLRLANFDSSSYDVIYSSCVLEHVEGAEIVLKNFSKWLKPGGVILLRFPNRNSTFGLITRLTPFWMHVLFKKYVQKKPNAGKPGYDPYPTFYDSILCREGIYSFCKLNDLTVKSEYAGGNAIKRLPYFLKFITKLITQLSFGNFSDNHTDLYYVLQKVKVNG